MTNKSERKPDDPTQYKRFPRAKPRPMKQKKVRIGLSSALQNDQTFPKRAENKQNKNHKIGSGAPSIAHSYPALV
jgi:hypothetical protein